MQQTVGNMNAVVNTKTAKLIVICNTATSYEVCVTLPTYLCSWTTN